MDESGTAGRVTRSVARRVSTEVSDTPSKTKRGRRSTTNASSDDGSVLTASAISGKDVESSPSVRITRGRKSSMLTEENVAALTPSRRTTRSQSIASEDTESTQVSATRARGRTPSKEKGPTTPKHEYANLVPRRFSILLSRNIQSPAPVPIPEEELENGRAESANSLDESHAEQNDIQMDKIEEKPDEKMLATTHKIEIDNVKNAIEAESSELDKSAVNIWIPKEDPDQTFSGHVPMDVDPPPIYVISDDDSNSKDAIVKPPSPKAENIPQERGDSDFNTTVIREEVEMICERLSTPSSSKQSGDEKNSPKKSAKKTSSSSPKQSGDEKNSPKLSAKKTPSDRRQGSINNSNEVPFATSDIVISTATTSSKKPNTPIIEKAPKNFEMMIRTGGKHSLSNQSPIKTNLLDQMLASPPIKNDSPLQNVVSSEMNPSSTELELHNNMDKQMKPESKMVDEVSSTSTAIPTIINKNIALVQGVDLDSTSSSLENEASTPELEFEPAPLPKSAFRLRSKSENVASTIKTTRKSMKLSELLTVVENDTPNIQKVSSKQTTIINVQPSPKATTLQPQIEQTVGLAANGAVTPRKQSLTNANRSIDDEQKILSPKFRQIPTIAVEEDIFAPTPPQSKEASKPEPSQSNKDTSKLVISQIKSPNASGVTAKKTPQKVADPAMNAGETIENARPDIVLPSVAIKMPVNTKILFESPIRKTPPVKMTGIRPLALNKPDTVKQMAITDSQTKTPQIVSKALAQKSVEFDKVATPKVPKAKEVSEGEKHADTPFPHNKSNSGTNLSRDSSFKDADASILSQKVLNFGGSWEPAVKGKASDKIDIQSAKSSKTSDDDNLFIPGNKKRLSKPIYESADEEEEDIVDFGKLIKYDDEEEERNSYIDDEAEEAEDEEDSMDEEERQYLEDNEIPDRGEDIGSEDTDYDIEDEADNDSDSFVVSDDSEEESGDELPKSKKQRYSRILAVDGSSDEENTPLKIDDDDVEFDVPISARLEKINKRKSLAVPENVAKEPTATSRKSLSAVNGAQLPDLPFPNFVLPNDKKKIIAVEGSTEVESSTDDTPLFEKLLRNTSRKSMPMQDKSKSKVPALNNSLSGAGKTPSKLLPNFTGNNVFDSGEGDELPIAERIKKNKARKSTSFAECNQEESSELANTKTPLKQTTIANEKTTSNKKSARKSLKNKTNEFVEESVGGGVVTENVIGHDEEDVGINTSSTKVLLSSQKRNSLKFVEEQRIPAECAESEHAGGSAKKKGKLSLDKSLNASKVFEEINNQSVTTNAIGTNNSFDEAEADVDGVNISVRLSAKKRRSIKKSNESFVDTAVETENEPNSVIIAKVPTPKQQARSNEASDRTILHPKKSNISETKSMGSNILSEKTNNPETPATIVSAGANIRSIDLTKVLERCNLEVKRVENRKRQREDPQNDIAEEKASKRKLKKDKKKAEREAEERRQKEREEREEMAKKVNKQKKATAHTAASANEVAVDAINRKDNSMNLKSRGATTKTKMVADEENIRPFPQPEMPKNFNFQPKARKRLQILRDKKTGNTWSVSERTPSPPPRIQNGFLETPQTPVAHNWNIKNLKPILFNGNKKRKVREIIEPSNVLPKPKWSNENGLATNSKRIKPSNGFVNQSDSSEFRVHSLAIQKKKKKARDLLPQQLLNFRQQNMYGSNTPRVDSATLNRQKQANAALSKTR